jgi:hypothetical protein
MTGFAAQTHLIRRTNFIGHKRYALKCLFSPDMTYDELVYAKEIIYFFLFCQSSRDHISGWNSENLAYVRFCLSIWIETWSITKLGMGLCIYIGFSFSCNRFEIYFFYSMFCFSQFNLSLFGWKSSSMVNRLWWYYKRIYWSSKTCYLSGIWWSNFSIT